jgi:hypothetical protein
VRRLSPDVPSLTSGAVIAALGVVVLLDSAGAVDVSLGWMAVALTAGVGVILIVLGLVDDGSSRHD